MASQTIQDVKAIYAAAKAKFDSLPEVNRFRVHTFLMQCMLAGSVILIIVIALLVIQLHFQREATEQAYRDASDMRQLNVRLREATRSK